MIDPYREGEGGSRTAFFAEQRVRIARAGRGMVIAAAIGMAAAIVVIVAAIAKDRPLLALVAAVPGLFSGIVLQAGSILRGLPGDVRDYAVVERSLRRLLPMYIVKGIVGLAALSSFVVGYCGRF
jgi:uncharacterized membrane protein